MVDKAQKKIAARLKNMRINRGIRSAAEASRIIGFDTPITYQQYENGTRPLTLEPAIRIARRLGSSLDWLLLGIGNPQGTDGAQEIPIIAWVSAGKMMRDDLADEALGWLRVMDIPKSGDWIALKVVGDSMDRISPPDSTILVDRRDKRLVANGLYVIDDGEGNATYKRFRPDPKRFEPVSVNPVHEPIYPDNDPTVIGRVRRTILDV